MRADRLLSILLFLQQRGKMTTKELAQALEVSVRTIHRDMDALSAVGIPVVAERGKAGGWRLLDDFRAKLTVLNREEISSLFVAPSLHVLQDLGIAGQARLARQKLMAAMPSAYRQAAEQIWERIYVDTSTWRQTTDRGRFFREMQQAVWREQRVRIRYERADGHIVERKIDPLGLVAMGSKWYVVARTGEGMRTYRMSRIQAVDRLEETFIRPASFRLADYWHESKQAFVENLPQYRIEVELSPAIVERLRFGGRIVKEIQTDAPLPDGWIPATLWFDVEQEAAEYVLGFADQIRVRAPAALRTKIIQMAQAVLRHYGRQMDGQGELQLP
ncbi:putative DNA-binding transcriptional regulator YafY [Laceyella sediminis]|uniref:DNA-binding transcriptional regulator YafY n=1 Tax=Laceyella sediminis TaxID=573074 RepID=A0ABX5ERP0_9BACL|nr:YafY family protein [Laceyella sediminis]PRZ13970.1 putative DNA-binding transcriptional regulator YafY [Laceyella sediminis]